MGIIPAIRSIRSRGEMPRRPLWLRSSLNAAYVKKRTRHYLPYFLRASEKRKVVTGTLSQVPRKQFRSSYQNKY